MSKANSSQKAMIHVLKGKLNLPDEHYRDMLAAYNVSSSVDLSFADAKEFIQLLMDRCRSNGIDTGNKSKSNGKGFITNAQAGMVVKMWFKVSRQTNNTDRRKALNEFIKNKWGISQLKWVPSETVPKIVRTIKAMGGSNDK